MINRLIDLSIELQSDFDIRLSQMVQKLVSLILHGIPELPEAPSPALQLNGDNVYEHQCAWKVFLIVGTRLDN